MKAHTIYNAMGGIKTATTGEQAGEQNLTLIILSDRDLGCATESAEKSQ